MVNEEFKHKTIIQTPRLLLRPIEYKHVDFTWDMRSYRETYKWTMAGQWLEKSESHAWIQNALESEKNYNFIIELLPQQGPPPPEANSNPLPPELPETKSPAIGSIGLHRDYEVGYMFHPDYWGQGYATEALNAFVNKVWEMLPEVEKLSALTDSENEGSKGVLRKCGFREVRRGPYVNATMGERVEVKFEDVRPK